jgi:hypothetical protein
MLASEIEMPIDPNEPTYCTCGRVSFGEMIGCDNPDVRSKCVIYNLTWLVDLTLCHTSAQLSGFILNALA